MCPLKVMSSLCSLLLQDSTDNTQSLYFETHLRAAYAMCTVSGVCIRVCVCAFMHQSVHI